MYQPEQIVILIQRNDGGMTIMSYVTKSFLPGPNKLVHFTHEPTLGNIGAEIVKARLDCKRWRFLNPGEELPTDHTFRDAWTVSEKSIDVDMPKAREIHKQILRSERAPLLAALDTEFMRALEAGDVAAQTEIASRKQKLRDATDNPAIEAAATLEELKAVALPSDLEAVLT